METTNESQTHQTAELEAFVMAPEEASTLSEVEISNKRTDFYKNLLKTARSKKELITTTQEKPKPLEFDAKALEEKINLRLAGHSESEVRFMENYAKGAGISLSKAKEDPIVISALEAQKAKATAGAATLEPSGKTTVTVKDATFSQLSTDDKKKNYAGTVQSLIEKTKQKK
ncbi:MAG: hypothetical protein AAB875_00490 [Patescibacteria group bacterium]